MTIIRVGATSKYAAGWDSLFGKGRKAEAIPSKNPKAKPAAAKKAASKTVKKKSAAKRGKK